LVDDDSQEFYYQEVNMRCLSLHFAESRQPTIANNIDIVSLKHGEGGESVILCVIYYKLIIL